MNLRALASIFALVLAACGTPNGPTDSSVTNCGSARAAADRAAPVPCATMLSVPGGCRNELLSPVCISNAYQCPAGTVRRTQCTCFDEQCEAGVDAGSDASESDSAAIADSASDANPAD